MQLSNGFEGQQDEDLLPDSSEPSVEAPVNMSRRAFLGSVAAALATTALPEEADAQQPRLLAANTSGKEVVEKPKKPTIEELAEKNTFVVREAPTEPNGEGFRGPSLKAPTAYMPRPETISLRIEPETNGLPLNQTYLLNLPRDIGEVARLGSIVKVKPVGLKDVVSELKLVTSQPNNNKFLSCHVQGNPTGGPMSVEIEVLSWMSKPVGMVEGRKLYDANSRNKMIADPLVAAENVNMMVNSRMKYDANVRDLDPAAINGVGDCGSFAVCVQKANADFEPVIGYIETDEGIPANGGGHAWNVNPKGNLHIDTPFKVVGVGHHRYTATAVGTEYNFEEGSGWESRSGKHKSYNGWQAIGEGNVVKASVSLSTPGKGEDGQQLLALMRNVPETIKAANAEHKKARQEVNALPNLRKTLAKN